MRKTVVPVFAAFVSILAPWVEAQDQSYTFTTLAGQSSLGSVDGAGANARFGDAESAAVDGSGNVYVADYSNHTLRKVTPAGLVSTLAGQAGFAGSADGAGNTARFNHPQGVAVDSGGNIYVADRDNHTIRKVTPAGVVTTLAGFPHSIGTTDGVGQAAQFEYPSAVAVDALGNVYVTDSIKHTLRKVTPGGTVTTLAGLAGTPGTADGTGSGARFNNPTGMAVDGAGNIYVADSINSTIRKVTPTGVVTTVAGLAGSAGRVDGVGAAARFNFPQDMAIDSGGNLYVANIYDGTVRKITPAFIVTTLSGEYNAMRGLAVDSAGNLYGCTGFAIKKGTPAGVTIMAGVSSPYFPGSADGFGANARFTSACGVVVDSAGNLFVSDDDAIRKISPTGAVTTFAGQLGVSGSADGTGASALLRGQSWLAMDRVGNLYVAESSSHTIRKVTPSGVVTTLAGLAGSAGSADGNGNAARFNYPQGIAVDADGNVYVADSGNDTIRKVTPTGVVTTLAGSAGKTGSADGTGSGARFNAPVGLAVDQAGNVYVADSQNEMIRKVSPAGIVTTLAGQFWIFGNIAGPLDNLDGKGAAARFTNPSGVAVDAVGNVFVTDTFGNTIRKITPDGTVTTVAGLAGISGGTDGSGSVARFAFPISVAVDAFSNLYVADTNNNEIRKGVPAGATAPVIVTQPASVAIGAGLRASFTVGASGSAALAYQWQRQPAGTTGFVALADGGAFSGATTATLAISPVTGAMDGDQFQCVVNDNIVPVATSQRVTLSVIPPPSFTSVDHTTFVVGAESSFAVTAPGASAFAIVDGTFPSWATLNPTTGVISGTPLTGMVGLPFVFVIQATNYALASSIQTFVLFIGTGPAITTQPNAQTVNIGDTAVFTAGVAGVPPFGLQWTKDGVPLTDSGRFSGTSTKTLVISGAQLSDAGSYALVATIPDAGTATSLPADLSVVAPPVITTQPVGQVVALDGSATFSVAATSATPLTYQWFYNGQPIKGATTNSYFIPDAGFNWAGQYAVRVTDAVTSIVSQPGALGVSTTAKIVGLGSEVASDIVHPNGHIYDQVLLTGYVATMMADPGQVLRISCIDLNDDIVQVEFSGAGTINLRLDDFSGPVVPVKYNQGVSYMKGHPSIVISGADETTNVSVFSVGRATAVNQALFRDDVTYDGVADLGYIAIASVNGKFGGIFTANASYFDTKSSTGILAPGVQFTGPVLVGNIVAADAASAVLVLGSGSDVRITGGDLAQMNHQSVRVGGIDRLVFTAGATSHGVVLPAKHNQGRLVQNGSDVTDKIVVNPTP